jgi:hypothetical protein
MKGIGAFVATVLAANTAAACTPPAVGTGWQQLESARYIVAFRPQAAPAVGQLFALDLALCAKSGALPQRIQVDAHMPAHRHGMNYRPSLQPVAEGVYRAEGLMLHMPGRWEFLFDLSADGRTDRLVAPLDLDG